LVHLLIGIIGGARCVRISHPVDKRIDRCDLGNHTIKREGDYLQTCLFFFNFYGRSFIGTWFSIGRTICVEELVYEIHFYGSL
jgi:hypothetical protein